MAAAQISDQETGQIAAVRAFNRFYTARLGLLRRRHLDGEFSLTEARILYETGVRPWLTASDLCSMLALDAGYISRLLAQLTKRGLIRQTASKNDGREKLLTLTPAGERQVSSLDEQSNRHIQELLRTLPRPCRKLLVESLSNARTVLGDRPQPALRVVRLPAASDDALQILLEYYEAVNVVLRDTPKAIQNIVDDPSSGLWLAYIGNRAAGCVMLRPLASIPLAGECKRLYVRPDARGHGIASALLDAMEQFARGLGFKWIYLDTYDDLKPAIALYRKRGYEACQRYNKNPQATVFLRRKIA